MQRLATFVAPGRYCFKRWVAPVIALCATAFFVSAAMARPARHEGHPVIGALIARSTLCEDFKRAGVDQMPVARDRIVALASKNLARGANSRCNPVGFRLALDSVCRYDMSLGGKF